MGAHMYLRIGELCREWNLECNAAQLDVRKAFDHVCHAAALRAMEEMGVGVHSRALIAKAWSLSKVRARLANTTSEPVSLERGLPQGAPESPIIFAMILECVVRRCEKKWAAKGWGFWLDGVRWVSASYADDIFLISATKRDLEAMIKDITAELEAVGLGLGANKAIRDATRRHRTDTVGAGTDLRGNGTGLERIFVGSCQKQTESRSGGNEEMVTYIQTKKREWEDKAEPDGNISVGKCFVGKRPVDTDESDEKCDRQVERRYSKHDTGDQERCRRGDGSVVEKIPSCRTRDTEETRPFTVEHGGETRPPMGRTCGETPGEPLDGCSGESKSSTILALGAAAPHGQVDRSPPEEVQNLPVGRSAAQGRDAQDRLSWRQAEP